MTASAHSKQPPAPSRREFLNLAFSASLVLLAAGSCGGIVWFMRQQRVIGDSASGLFQLELDDLPLPGASPIFLRDAQAYLANMDGGLIALLGQCPYDRYLVRWSVTNGRFECPGCGSKFQRDGVYLKGSAARDLSRGIVRIMTDQGMLTTPPDGAPVPVDDVQSIVLDIQQPIPGTPRPELPLP